MKYSIPLNFDIILYVIEFLEPQHPIVEDVHKYKYLHIPITSWLTGLCEKGGFFYPILRPFSRHADAMSEGGNVYISASSISPVWARWINSTISMRACPNRSGSFFQAVAGTFPQIVQSLQLQGNVAEKTSTDGVGISHDRPQKPDATTQVAQLISGAATELSCTPPDASIYR